jgi:hypothetical protein
VICGLYVSGITSGRSCRDSRANCARRVLLRK